MTSLTRTPAACNATRIAARLACTGRGRMYSLCSIWATFNIVYSPVDRVFTCPR